MTAAGTQGQQERRVIREEALQSRRVPEAVRVMCVLLRCCREILESGRGLSFTESSEEGITLCS